MKNFQPKKMLVTGGAGFIGANFVRYYLEHYPDCQIINLDLLTYAGSKDNLKNLPNAANHHFVQGDICNAQLIKQLLREHEIDTIVHFAAESHVDRSISGPAQFVQTNILGTFTLLEAARQFWLDECNWGGEQCRFHHISTDEVYGTLAKDDPAFAETKAYEPNSPYSASKASSDHLVRAYHHTYGLPVTTSNCSNNYGPYQHTEKLIPTIIRCCVEQKNIPIYGDGSNIRDWLFVTDHCSAIARIVHQGQLGETYNVGGNHEVNNINIAKTICHIMDAQFPENAPHDKLITFVKDRPGHDWRYAIDNRKIKHDLGWEPAETFETGMAKTVAFYL